ncbi:hypothetical protein KP509_09G052300 [Ceratopteris richardii]|uniref:Uncharacterized protein n=1 Tax=Ceratopteris richardii TaxID=49495 RepID=A0A8T2U079_CERRI|nr:hypothetical protein KP509_09G052300 [Ceratopteris richardii]
MPLQFVNSVLIHSCTITLRMLDLPHDYVVVAKENRSSMSFGIASLLNLCGEALLIHPLTPRMVFAIYRRHIMHWIQLLDHLYFSIIWFVQKKRKALITKRKHML